MDKRLREAARQYIANKFVCWKNSENVALTFGELEEAFVEMHRLMALAAPSEPQASEPPAKPASEQWQSHADHVAGHAMMEEQAEARGREKGLEQAAMLADRSVGMTMNG